MIARVRAATRSMVSGWRANAIQADPGGPRKQEPATSQPPAPTTPTTVRGREPSPAHFAPGWLAAGSLRAMADIDATPRTPPPAPADPTAPGILYVDGRLRPSLRAIPHLVLLPWCAGALTDPARPPAVRLVALVTALTAAVSLLYHRVPWSRSAEILLQKLDHTMIFGLSAISFLPIAPASLCATQLALAAVGTYRVWAHRHKSSPLLVAIHALPVIFLHGHPLFASVLRVQLTFAASFLALLLRWPDPSPAHFGYHEVFHLLSIAGFVGLVGIYRAAAR